MTTPDTDLADNDVRSVEKLARLRELTAEAFDELDHGKVIMFEGEDELADFIRGIGRRAADRAESEPPD